MATITQTWTTDSMSDSTVASQIDDKVDGSLTAIDERLKNGGHSWPASNAATSGLHAVGASNYVANEWSVYAADLATKLLTVGANTVSINKPSAFTGNVAVTGKITASTTMTVNGSDVVVKSAKRRVEFGWDVPNGSNPLNFGAMVPFATTGTTMTGQLICFTALCPSAATRTFTLYKRTPTRQGRAITTDPFATAGAITMVAVSPATSAYGIRAVSFSRTTLTSGDTVFVDVTGTPATTITLTADFDY